MGTSLRRAPSWEKSANHFSLEMSGGEGLTPHGRAAPTGEAERGAEPGARCAPDVQTLLPPRAGPGRWAPPDPPLPLALQEQRGSGSVLGRRRGWGSCLKVSQL